MNKYLLALLIIAFFAWYLSYLATRLDRLHNRVETSWANLDGLLQRRAAIAIEIARSEISDPASSLLLTFAAHQAREASVCAIVLKQRLASLELWVSFLKIPHRYPV